jgi:hypothetical protein
MIASRSFVRENTLEKLCKIFDMPASEFIALGESKPKGD